MQKLSNITPLYELWSDVDNPSYHYVQFVAYNISSRNNDITLHSKHIIDNQYMNYHLFSNKNKQLYASTFFKHLVLHHKYIIRSDVSLSNDAYKMWQRLNEDDDLVVFLDTGTEKRNVDDVCLRRDKYSTFLLQGKQGKQ